MANMDQEVKNMCNAISAIFENREAITCLSTCMILICDMLEQVYESDPEIAETYYEQLHPFFSQSWAKIDKEDDDVLI